MSIEAIAAVTAGLSAPAAAATAVDPSALQAAFSSGNASRSAVNGTTFENLLTNLQELSAEMRADAKTVEGLASGDAVSLHRVIMDLESTKLKFELALQVRNRVLEAYQELMRMQI